MFKLPDLEYDYDALAPAISGQIMRLHHDKHHATYVDKLNAAIANEPSLDGVDLFKMLQNLDDVPESVRTAVRNHGGGHYNHSLFWQVMTPHSAGEPTGDLKVALTSKYGDFQKFVDDFSAAATGVFGSGWAWLLPNLTIATTPNQDLPQDQGEPLLALDVWEHAYYLDYNAARADYIKAWWSVVNWDFVAYRFAKNFTA
jgi:Fe-Mn family superoxide dismutase